MDSLRDKVNKLRALANDSAATPSEIMTAQAKIKSLESRIQVNSGHAILPQNLETQNYLYQLEVGHGGWMVPWGMVADENGYLYLNKHYTFDDHQHGTACLYVEHRVDGYHVWTYAAQQNGYSWDRSESRWGRDIPVVAVHTELPTDTQRKRRTPNRRGSRG